VVVAVRAVANAATAVPGYFKPLSTLRGAGRMAGAFAPAAYNIRLNLARIELSWAGMAHLLLFSSWCLFVLLCWPVALLAPFLLQLLPPCQSEN